MCLQGRHVPSNNVISGAYSSQFSAGGGDEEFGRVVKEVEAFLQRVGRRPRMLVAKMGQDGHDR